MPESLRACRNVAAVVPLVLLSGCFLAEIDDQIAMIEDTCLMSGTVTAPSDRGEAVVVVLQGDGDDDGSVPLPVDYTLADRSGQWRFGLAPGNYSLLAFQDVNGNLVLDDPEPAHRHDNGRTMACGQGGRLEEIAIDISADDRLSDGFSLNISRDRGVLEAATRTAVSLGQLTAFGEVASLDEPRFSIERGKDSLWRPMDFIRAGHAGVYMLEPLDPERVPVLFIHGINGSPRVLATPIESLDSERFQPLFYYYPSGLRLGQIARHLYRITHELELRHGIGRMHVIAHSMGGLVARAWLLERARRGSPAVVPTFISLSTPWLGHDSARQGVEHSPIVVPVWRDMASGSEFLQELFSEDESGAESGATAHHLLFSYHREGWIARQAGDGVATLASMLAPAAQRQATGVYGVNATHTGILESDDALDRIHRILLANEEY